MQIILVSALLFSLQHKFTGVFFVGVDSRWCDLHPSSFILSVQRDVSTPLTDS